MPAADPDLVGVIDRLGAAGCVAAPEEAAELVAAAPDEQTLEDSVRRREQGEPLAWITGSVVFCGRRLNVARGVYVPRVQSEELARRASALLPEGGRAIDLCTGVGAIAAHLMAQVPTATIIGCDMDAGAAACARSNGVPTVVADLAEPIRQIEAFDIVTAVAPYVPTDDMRLLPADVQRYEPRPALDGGPEGLDTLRRLIATAQRLLRPGGWLLTEIGGDQDEALAPTLAAAGFDPVIPWRDIDGDLRGIQAQSSGTQHTL